jgi:hypothetical protein
LGFAFVPHIGVQNDEALFAHAIYEPRAGLDTVVIGRSRFPLMLMSYLGTLKSWIYRPVFRAFGTGVSALRDPMILAGGISVWLFFLLLRRAAGTRAALIGCLLLAVDSTYLLTSCFDWGPVALQHLLTIGGMFLLLRFYQEGSERALAGGMFLWGLAMWDKALAIWMLSGICTAAIGLFGWRIWRVTTRRRLAISVLAFALGVLPLLIYNVRNDFATFHGNFHYDSSDIPNKARLLMNTAAGPGLFGWLMYEDWQTPKPHQPKGAIQTFSARISALAGYPRHNLMVYAFALALLLAPLARGNALRTILFALIAMAVGWVQMAVGGPEVGGSVHHTILLWPLPAMVIAVSFGAASRRLGRAGIPALAAVMAAMTVSSLLVTNEYYRMTLRNGGAQAWSDAIFPLSSYLKGVPARAVICEDWGIMDSLRLLNRGKLPLEGGTDRTTGDPALHLISEGGNVFIAHTKAYEFFPDNRKLVEFAAGAGYIPEIMATIPDSHGRPVFEVYHFMGPAVAPR